MTLSFEDFINCQRVVVTRVNLLKVRLPLTYNKYFRRLVSYLSIRTFSQWNMWKRWLILWNFLSCLDGKTKKSLSFFHCLPFLNKVILVREFCIKAQPLHKKWSFPLKISSIHVTKSAFLADLITFTEEILNVRIFCAVNEVVF